MELMSLLTWWFGTLDFCMGIKLTLTHLLYSASPGFCPVAANIPKKRLNTAGGEYCSSRLNVRFATKATQGSQLNKSGRLKTVRMASLELMQFSRWTIGS
jgi:hypothetical protein